MISDTQIKAELADAARKAIDAKRHLAQVAPGQPGYQAAVITYLEATVLHLAIVSVAQARQCESLAAEVDELREEMGKVRYH